MNALILDQFKVRMLEESIPRLLSCLCLLDEELVWTPPAENMMSVGNQILHINGNSRQWIFAGLLGQPDVRVRDDEFKEGNLSVDALIEIIETLKSDLEDAIPQIESLDLTAKRNVQVFSEHGVSILVHVIEHTSYHTGQIALLTKLFTHQDLQFYGDLNLNAN